MKKEIIIGIDISKDTLDVSVIVKGNTAQIPYAQFKNNEQGFKHLFKWVKQVSDSLTDEWLVCMEHTGIYTLELCCFLEKKSISKCLENALKIKRSMGIQRGKNDKADSKTIALYAYRFQDQLTFFTVPTKSLLNLRVLFAQRQRLVSIRQQLSLGNSSLDSYEKDIADYVIKSNEKLIGQMEKQIALLEEKTTQTIEQDEQLNQLYTLMKSVPGVGLQTITYMLVITNGMKSFDDSRKFACYCGVAPFEYQSGSSIRGKTKVSYLANRKMKEMLHMAALNAVRFDEEMRNYYERKIAEGKNAMSVLNAVKFKLIGRLFSVVRRGEPYQKNYLKKVA